MSLAIPADTGPTDISSQLMGYTYSFIEYDFIPSDRESIRVCFSRHPYSGAGAGGDTQPPSRISRSAIRAP